MIPLDLLFPWRTCTVAMAVLTLQYIKDTLFQMYMLIERSETSSLCRSAFTLVPFDRKHDKKKTLQCIPVQERLLLL